MNFKKIIFQKDGFTVLELAIILAILSVLAAVIFTSMSSFRSGKALQVVSEDILSLVEEARGYTLSSKDGYAYGVHFESSRIVLFRGSPYLSGDSNNKAIDIDGAVEISAISLVGGGVEVLFQRLTGKTSQNGSIIIRLKSDTAKTKTIIIEKSGIASVN